MLVHRRCCVRLEALGRVKAALGARWTFLLSGGRSVVMGGLVRQRGSLTQTCSRGEKGWPDDQTAAAADALHHVSEPRQPFACTGHVLLLAVLLKLEPTQI